jgi:hypothetical protein
VLFRRTSERFIDLSQKQSDFLKDRVEIVDKTSVIFTRTIDQQEKEIRKLREDLEAVNVSLEQTRLSVTDRSVEEVRSLAGTVSMVLSLQEATIAMIAAGPGENTGPQEALVARSRKISRSFESQIPDLLKKRDLSRYIVLASAMQGADALISELRSLGLTASIYESPYPGPSRDLSPVEHEAIWVGRKIPPEIAIASIKLARNHWPFLKNIHISGDVGDDTPPEETHSQIYFGGSSATARRYGLRPCTDAEIERLDPTSSSDDFQSAIRSHYDKAGIAAP